MRDAVRSTATSTGRRAGLPSRDKKSGGGGLDAMGGRKVPLDGSGPRAARRSDRGSRGPDGHRTAARRRLELPRERGERTRHRVAEALIGLVEEGSPSPTAKEVAARAGVSVRLVFHHFDDMDALHHMAMEVQTATHWAKMKEVAPDLPLAHRVERTVRRRARLFDAVGPLRRAETALAGSRHEVAKVLARSDLVLRDWLETTFAPELDSAGRGRRELLDAIDVAASWETWDRLRQRQHLSPAAARRVVAQTLSALLP